MHVYGWQQNESKRLRENEIVGYKERLRGREREREKVYKRDIQWLTHITDTDRSTMKGQANKQVNKQTSKQTEKHKSFIINQ